MELPQMCRNLLLGSILAVAASWAAEPPRQGLLTLGKTATPPQIDGVLDDALWQESIKLGPFMLPANGGPAKEQTTAQLGYDDAFLYLGIRAEAFCLQPETNQTHAFQKNATAQDDEAILKDDCIVFIISHGDAEPVMYDFFINANGAVLDSHGRGPDFWGTRDLSWNSGIRCQTRVESGYWTIEAAIPLAALGLADEAKPTCRFLVGRIEKRSNETSAWQHLSRAFHIDDDWSTLRFAGLVPAIGRLDLPEFRSSQNVSSITLSQPWPELLRWQQQRQRQNGDVIAEHVDIPANAPAQRWEMPVTLTEQEPFAFQLSLGSSAGDIFLATPRYAVKPSFTDLVCLDKATAILCNGQPVKGNNIALQPGINRLEVEVPAGQKLRFEIGTHRFELDDTWKQEGGAYHKILFLDQTVLWPNWKAQALHLSPGQGQQLLFWPNGLPEVDLANGYKLFLEVPNGCELRGASGYYKLQKVEFREIGLIDGYRRYELLFPGVKKYTDSTLTELHRWCAVLLMPTPRWNGGGELRFYAATPDHLAQEIPQRVPLVALPPVNGRQPKNIFFQLWAGWLRNMDDINLRDQIYATYIPAGITEANAPAIAGLRTFSLINLESWNLDLKNWLAQGDDYRQLQINDKRHRCYPCSGRMLYTPEGRDTLVQAAKAWQEKNQVDHCNLDFEGSVWGNCLSCFCPLCLKQFADAYQLKTVPTPEQLKNTYEKEWITWMNKKMAELAVLLQEGVKSARPDVVFSVYTGYHSEETKRRYGVDWEMLRGKIDLGMCGYGYNAKLLQATREALAPTPMASGIIIHPYTSKITSYPSFWSQAEILQHLLVGRVGLLLYYYPSMDGRSFYNIGEITRLAADYEELILKGKRIEAEFPLLKGPSGDNYQVLRHAGQTMIVLMNRGRQPAAYQLDAAVPALAGKTLRDYYTGQTDIMAGDIAPGGVRVLLVE
ncbi:MAG TPA: hypothetical protein PLT23_04640 [Lentisphaeria bacterium]|nr:hypothetical protein [Lentisphaerota bacterium]OQC15065.1 MAG: hypothetical protein BWX73_01518 [Lentisphaerae bacterium ADurb.Bin082]HPY89992.1 hypothetical protein [Lentisphaeria bacterium]